MRGSIPLWYILGEYPVHQGKLNIRHPIYLSSGFMVSVFIMAGVTKEVPEELYSLRLRNSLM